MLLMVLVVAVILIVMLGGGWVLQLEKERKRVKSEEELRQEDEVSRLKIATYASAINVVTSQHPPDKVDWTSSTERATGGSPTAEITTFWRPGQVVVIAIWRSYGGVTIKARGQTYFFGADSNFSRDQLSAFLIALIEQPEASKPPGAPGTDLFATESETQSSQGAQ